jgi:D-lyxose ketol-isomerase
MQARGDLALLKERQMGWDVTDFGSGDFDRLGLFLFTVRNGDNADLAAGRGMLYAEKIMISRKDQVTPMHRHDLKAEDIINRGGGTLTLELFTRAPDGGIDATADVEVYCDGIARRMAAGDKLRLTPGESVTLMPHHWHSFWGEGADVLVAEVSTVNDDRTDNIFREPVGRFAEIEEDEAPVHLLVSDYDKWLGNQR